VVTEIAAVETAATNASTTAVVINSSLIADMSYLSGPFGPKLAAGATGQRRAARRAVRGAKERRWSAHALVDDLARGEAACPQAADRGADEATYSKLGLRATRDVYQSGGGEASSDRGTRL